MDGEMTKQDQTEQEDFNTSAISDEETRYLEQTALLGLEYVLSDFAKQFQKSARRWELMAYPAMVVFGLLAISGFWLIYSLTKDMNRMSDAIDPNMGPNLSEMSKNIADLDVTIRVMSTHIASMAEDIDSMNTSIKSMENEVGNMSTKLNTMEPLLFNMAEMNHSIKQMTYTTGVMSHDVNKMSRPMRFMNNFVP
jgi:methyl-accepting chemotaxis protein